MGKQAVTNLQIANANGALGTLAGRDDLPFKMGYRIAKTLRQLEPYVKAMDGQRQKIAEKHAAKDGDGNPKMKKIPNPQDPKGPKVEVFDIPKENDKAAQKDLDELMEIENDVDIQGFRFSQFDEDAQIAPAVLMAIDWLIEDDSDGDKEGEVTPDNPGPGAPPTQ